MQGKTSAFPFFFHVTIQQCLYDFVVSWSRAMPITGMALVIAYRLDYPSTLAVGAVRMTSALAMTTVRIVGSASSAVL